MTRACRCSSFTAAGLFKWKGVGPSLSVTGKSSSGRPGRFPADPPVWTDAAELDSRLHALESEPDLAVLDFDETLWLRNSTEEFIAFARPAVLVAVVLQILGLIKPWRLISRAKAGYYRDWIRVWAVVIVAPWSVLAWRRHGPAAPANPSALAQG